MIKRYHLFIILISSVSLNFSANSSKRSTKFITPLSPLDLQRTDQSCQTDQSCPTTESIAHVNNKILHPSLISHCIDECIGVFTVCCFKVCLIYYQYCKGIKINNTKKQPQKKTLSPQSKSVKFIV